MSFVRGLECILCHEFYSSLPSTYTCPSCGGVLDVLYDYESIKGSLAVAPIGLRTEPSILRYSELLPIDPKGRRPRLRVGGSPLYHSPALSAAIGCREVFVKDDGVNPTASSKDRASWVAVVKALEAGADTVACASTGNAASSLAGNAASAGLKSVIFVPERAPAGKLAQMLLFGATVVKVQGNYEDAYALSRAAIDEFGWYNRNAAINPYMLEGKKTVSFEICEGMGYTVPDWVAVSVGDGCTVAGVYKGFAEFFTLGLSDRIPRILGVQAEGSNPISEAFRTGRPVSPGREDTIADSIAVGIPRNPVKALRAIRDSQGTMVDVSDQEILQAMKLLGSTSGVFGEPAGVACLAGLRKALEHGLVPREATACVIVTGNGLKDIGSGMKAAREPITIPPSLDMLVSALEESHV